MALHLNLLHEEITELRQRQRDPLKIGTKVLGGLGALMLLFYAFKAYQTLQIKSRLSSVEREWAKVEPAVTAAQKRTAELNAIIGTTRVLDATVDDRFLWAPLLQRVSRCVAPNAQLTSIAGTSTENGKAIDLVVEGIAAGREPRAAAEELRQLLSEQLGEKYGRVKVEFKMLEDLDTLVNVAGTNMAMSRYIISASLTPGHTEEAKPTIARAPKQ